MMMVSLDDREAAIRIGVAEQDVQSVYNYYLAVDVPEDGWWWVQPFDEWLSEYWPLGGFRTRESEGDDGLVESA
jgi:hypothetical protein